MSDVPVSSTPGTPTPPSSGNEGGSGAAAPQGVKHVDATPSKTTTPSPEMFEVKVNGKMVKLTRQEVLDRASMSEAAHQKFSEAAKTRQEVDRIINNAKKNPIEALMDPALGLTKDQIRQAFEAWYSKEYIEPETLTPEQRENKELKAYKAQIEQERALAKEKSEQEELARLTTKQIEFINSQIIEALEAGGLAKNKHVAARVAYYMREANRQGWDAPISMIVQQVKNEQQGMMSGVTEDSTIEQLTALYGERAVNILINKIRQHDLKQLREKRNLGPPVTNSSRNDTSKRSKSWADVQKSLNDIKRGKITW